MLSSDDLTPQLARLREAGLNAYLVKPITRRELFQAISKVLAEDESVRVVAAAEPTSPMAPPPVDLLPAARILVAEDSPDSRLLISAFLRHTRCQLDFAENGQIAVEKFTRNRYDLVLMDMQMPVMDGYAATRAIRAWELRASCPAHPRPRTHGIGARRGGYQSRRSGMRRTHYQADKESHAARGHSPIRGSAGALD